MAALDFCCCMWAFCGCSGQGLLFIVVHRVSHHGGFFCCGAWILDIRSSVVAVPGLSSPG